MADKVAAVVVLQRATAVQAGRVAAQMRKVPPITGRLEALEVMVAMALTAAPVALVATPWCKVPRLRMHSVEQVAMVAKDKRLREAKALVDAVVSHLRWRAVMFQTVSPGSLGRLRPATARLPVAAPAAPAAPYPTY